jgi:hypothetical protein
MAATMGSKAEEYRRNAEDAEREAERVKDPVAAETYRDIAHKWRQMAEQAHRLGS